MEMLEGKYVMNRNSPRFSPMQRKACIVLLCCALAIVASFVAAWVLPSRLDFSFGSSSYDKDAYPLDTSLSCVLPQSSEADAGYITSTVFVGDQYTVSLQTSNLITLDQYVGQKDLKISEVLSTACVNFANDPNTYTIPQALAQMKPRRVIITLGSNDAAEGVSPELFVQDYRQVVNSIATAYAYSDIIVNAVPPVLKGSENAGERQTYIDQYNQKLAELCEAMGWKFLNSTEMLKNSSGFAEETYFDRGTGTFSASGVNTLLSYVKSHAWQTNDQRPDTNDIPKRAASAAGNVTAEPTPTPFKHKVSYAVEEGKGTLTGNGQTGVSTIEFEVNDKETVSITAVAASGYTFYKWSDGQTSETRYDVVTQDLSVTAMFNDARVDLTLDRGDTTMKKDESISITANVKLGGKTYDNSNVQWAVNGDLQQNGGTFTFTPTEAGSYEIKAGIEINGTYKSAQIKVTVTGDPTTVSVSGTSTIEAGSAVTLNASVQNQKGDITWTCDQTGWTATGAQVQFTANEPGTYTLRAKNNGAEGIFTLTVNPRATAAPTPTPSPTPAPEEPQGGEGQE